MDKFLKVPCTITNTVVVDQDMDKDNIIASIPFSEMITPMTFTSDSKLYNDYTFLTLNMISQISGGMNNDFYNKIHPENIPLIWEDNVLDNMKGTPLYSIIKSTRSNLDDIIKKSVTECKDIDKFIKFFYLIYSSISTKSLILPIKGNNVICYIPIINIINFAFNQDTNIYYTYKDDNINIIALRNLKKGEELKFSPKLDIIPEINFIKYGLFPNDISLMKIILILDNNKINLQKNMTADDKKILRRIRKNPKHSKLKLSLQHVFNENMKVLKETLKKNKNNKDIMHLYSKHIYNIYKNNYPK